MPVVQSTYSFIFTIIYLVIASPFVYARGRGGGGGSGKGGDDGSDFASDAASNLAEQSWQWATFVAAVIAEFFAIMIFYKSILALDQYYRAIKKNGPSSLESWNTGTAFWAFGILGSFFLAAFYPLLVVQALAPDLFNVLSVTYSQIPTGMMLMCANLADITIACAFLVLLHHRQTLHFSTTSIWKRSVDISLIFLMVVITIVEAVFDSLTSTFKSLSKWQALVDIAHLYLALYLATTIDITVSFIILRRKMKANKMENKRTIHNLSYRVCSLLVIQGTFRLIEEIIIYLPSIQAANINYDALEFVDIFIKLLVYTEVLRHGLRNFSSMGMR